MFSQNLLVTDGVRSKLLSSRFLHHCGDGIEIKYGHKVAEESEHSGNRVHCSSHMSSAKKILP